MTIHFEDLWGKCEDFHKDNSDNNSSISEIINELVMKLELYSMIEQKSEISSKDIEKAKSRLIGEILLSITALSLKDNVNVFEALHTALIQHSIGIFSIKHQD